MTVCDIFREVFNAAATWVGIVCIAYGIGLGAGLGWRHAIRRAVHD